MITKLVAKLSLLAVLANACAADAPALSVTGFATLGAVHPMTAKPSSFAGASTNRPNPVSTSARLHPRVQASLPIGPKLDATVQLVSSEDPQGSYAPRVTWPSCVTCLLPA